LSWRSLPDYYAGAFIFGRNAMKMKTIGFAAIVAVAAVGLAIGSSAPSFAKKKKAEAMMPEPACQLMIHKPVCGVKGGLRQSYANSCYAVHDGAKVVSQGACKAHRKAAKKMAKPAMKKEMKKEMKKK
jgi:hypothetical protein